MRHRQRGCGHKGFLLELKEIVYGLCDLPAVVNVLCDLLALIEQAEEGLVDIDMQFLSRLSYLLEALRSSNDLLVLNIHLKVLLQVVWGALRIDCLQALVLIQLAKDHGNIGLYNNRGTLAVYLAMGSPKPCKGLVKYAVAGDH